MISSFLIALVITGNTINLSPELPASYQMQVRLDTLSHKLSGSEHIIFMNPTHDTLDKICFHLYPNAFSDTSSVFSREDARISRNIAGGNKSYIDVSNIVIDSVAIDSSAITKSGTLLYINLPSPLAPAAQINISLNFELLIPRVRVRMGYDQWGNYILCHWHPILCGYQNDRLVDFEYHANSEFFSNFSNYDVTISIPENFKIASTGELTSMGKDSAGDSLWHAVADTVIDFAFACGRSFHVFESDTLGIKIRYLLNPDHEQLFQCVDKITKYSLAYNSSKFFPYPYNTFNVVDLNSGATGMELPQMIVIDFLSPSIGNIARAHADFVISHEITHEWLYAVVASNEAEEPWLDEGVTSYVTSRLLTDNNANLDKFDVFGYNVSIDNLQRILCLTDKAEYPINLQSWDYPDPMSYNMAVYYRTTLVLQTLEGMIGQSEFDSIMNIYANRYRFRHPNENDFFNVMVEKTGYELGQFYYQFIAGTARVDYSVKSLEFENIPKSDSTDSAKYKITATLSRELDGILPQKLIIGLENGSKLDTTWDGHDRIKTFEFISNSRPTYAVIDSGYTYTLDENFSNNSLYLKPFSSRLFSFEWDSLFIREFILSLLL